MSTELAERLDWARAIAREAGRLTLRYFQTDDLAVERKQDDSPVTIADRQAEQLLRQRIAERFAADAILGEEFPEQSRHQRLSLDPGSDRRHQVVHQRRAAVWHDGRRSNTSGKP